MTRDNIMICHRRHAMTQICAYLMLSLLFAYPAQSEHFNSLKPAAQALYFNQIQMVSCERTTFCVAGAAGRAREHRPAEAANAQQTRW